MLQKQELSELGAFVPNLNIVPSVSNRSQDERIRIRDLSVQLSSLKDERVNMIERKKRSLGSFATLQIS
jgi:hypothetical protein